MSSKPDITEEILEQLGPDVVAFDYIEDMVVEPMYVSEIVRTMQEHDFPFRATDEEDGLNVIESANDYSHQALLGRVSAIVFLLEEQDRVETMDLAYNEDSGQPFTSVITDITGAIPVDDQDRAMWHPYKIVYNDFIGAIEMDDEVQEVIDMDATIEEKRELINNLSSMGEQNARDVEEIFVDVMERQFRNFDEIESGDFNDPGIDFWVNDKYQVDFGIAYEVSSRWVNAVDQPYFGLKHNEAQERDSDLTILAPSFTNTLLAEYEDPEDRAWHSDPLGESIHLHHLPQEKPYVYEPFVYERTGEGQRDVTGGTPVVVRDSDRLMDIMESKGRVGDRYPVVDSAKQDFTEALDAVFRDYDTITETEFRHQIREAIEPSLWKLMRPYMVEQFLVDMYWDTGLRQGQTITQDYIGGLVDRSGGTIGDWMSRERWDIITRGGGDKLSAETEEIWRRMYEGKDPFQEPYSGYRIQAEYNRYPHWDLSDWRSFYQDLTKTQRREVMGYTESFRENIDYQVMMGVKDRLLPSYSLILQRLRDMGVEIRPPDTAPQAPYQAHGDAQTIEWMLNRDEGVVAADTERGRELGPDRAQVFDSYLEVDVATWLSENGVPYAHEPFTIPSETGPGRLQWEAMKVAIRDTGDITNPITEPVELSDRDEDHLEDIGLGDRIEDVRERAEQYNKANILDMWTQIYDKHQLGNSPITPPVRDSLDAFRLRYVLPDLVIYGDYEDNNVPEGWDGWDDWTHILEVGGLWSLSGPVDEDGEWWDWYRVSGVAFKELVYKMLGIWDDVSFVIPLEPSLEEGQQWIVPNALQRDDNYVLFTSTTARPDLSPLADRLGLYGDIVEADSGITPPIRPVRYNRGLGSGTIRPEAITFDSINMAAVQDVNKAFPVAEDMFAYIGELGEVYVSDEGLHVRESQWRHDSMVMLREYLANELAEMSDLGLVDGLEVLD
jgi:hypothetical protein